jgi:hypothetical protein
LNAALAMLIRIYKLSEEDAKAILGNNKNEIPLN